jgi:hypothetical protein
MSNSALIGTSGTYFVMAQLAVRDFHASCTFGNAPYIDILVSSQDGRRSASVQVKTARSAQRLKGRSSDKALHHYEWYLGHKIASIPKQSNLFYAFVDLRLHYWEPRFKPQDVSPDIYIIPLSKIAKWYRKYVKPDGMSRLWVRPDFLEPYKDAYHIIKKAIAT